MTLEPAQRSERSAPADLEDIIEEVAGALDGDRDAEGDWARRRRGELAEDAELILDHWVTGRVASRSRGARAHLLPEAFPGDPADGYRRLLVAVRDSLARRGHSAAAAITDALEHR